MCDEVTAQAPGGDRAPAPSLVGGRYRLLRLLGAGGGGEVWLAEPGPVAIKRLQLARAADLPRARAEIAALRWLRLPGVVRLLDEGVEEDGCACWFAMELVEGQPWGPAPWAQLQGRLVALLDILDDVHRAGVVHGDLKPDNVRIGPGGEVKLIDFGIACGRAGPRRPEGARWGSPGWIAPELEGGASPSPAADLYAVGRMMSWSLGGEREAAPAEAWALAQALCQPDPSLRPASAGAAAAALGGVDRRSLPWPVERYKADLEQLFAGPEHFLHLPARAAAALGRLTEPAERRAALHRWLRRGLCRYNGQQLEIDRFALARLDLEFILEELGRLPPQEREGACLAATEAALEQGLPERALGLVEHLVEQHLQGADRLAELAAVAATRLETSAALNRAICALRRLPPSPVAEAADLLLQATERVLDGRAALAEELLPTGQLDEPLEIWRQAMRVQVLRARREEERGLLELEPWASTDERRASWLGWMGNLRYRQGRYAEAAELHLRSLAMRRRPDARGWAVNAAATDLLETGDQARCLELVEQGARAGRELGQPLMELMAWNLRRQALYRQGASMEPEVECVEAARLVNEHRAQACAVTEAAVAWRRGDVEALGRLAGPTCLEAPPTLGTLLLCLRAAAGLGPLVPVGELRRRCLAIGLPELRLQALALFGDREALSERELSALVEEGRPAFGAGRLDILDLDECRQRLGLGG